DDAATLNEHSQYEQGNEDLEEQDPEQFLVVRALYPFQSEDLTSLSFEKEELIQVLTQLESGWWYGYCRNDRGWFPSNYVEIITQDDYDAGSEETSEDDADLWLPQTTEEGQVFYYNTRSGESSWTIPTSNRQKEGTQNGDEDAINSRKDEQGKKNIP
ncbi:hypothetical protein BGZ65_004392, partial [Modicella reniformis]